MSIPYRLHRDADLGRAARRHAEQLGGTAGELHHPPRIGRAAVVHPHIQLEPGFQVRHAQDRGQLERAMGGSQHGRIVDLAIGGAPPGTAIRRYRCQAGLVEPEILVRVGPNAAELIGLADHVAPGGRRRPSRAARQEAEREQREAPARNGATCPARGERRRHATRSDSIPTTSA